MIPPHGGSRIAFSEGASNISDSEAGSTTSRPVERPESSQPPRREVRWVNLGANNRSLESIAHHFQNYVDCFLSSSPATLRRVRALDDLNPAFHTCPGYLREEIILTAEVSKSAIVSHAFADLGERCSFCGQLVTPISGSSSISIPASAGPSRPPDSTDRSHWKRPSITSMSRTSIPPVVNDVDNRDSFNMFNAGWILPPVDQKRGRHVPAERSSIPQTSIPQVVNDVDNRDSFSMFNAGWILPPDQKRGRRVPAERPALPPPRKSPRQNTGSFT